MKYIKLGKTELIVSDICFGCSELWHDDKALVLGAFDAGITFFDMADIYGCGKSEEMVGSVLKDFREQVILATKVGMDWRTQEPKGGEEHIVKSCEESLKRLQTDYIDLYQVHCYSSPESTSVLKKLQSQGKIRYFGVSNYNSNQLRNDPCLNDIVTNQIRFNFLQQDIYRDVSAICSNHGIALTAYSPLCKGLMTGKFTGKEQFPEGDIRYKDRMFSGDEFRENISRVIAFLDRNRVGDESNVQVALRWVMEKGIIPVMGARNLNQVRDNVKIA